jgi:hypothetical protein
MTNGKDEHQLLTHNYAIVTEWMSSIFLNLLLFVTEFQLRSPRHRLLAWRSPWHQCSTNLVITCAVYAYLATQSNAVYAY